MKTVFKRVMSLIAAMCCFFVAITFSLPSNARIINASTEIRYTVLVLDTSGGTDFRGSLGNIIYSADPALSFAKQAANKFISDLHGAGGTSYLAIVSYDSTAHIVSTFSDDILSSTDKVNQLTAGDRNLTNIAAGLETANDLINEISDENVIKNVVLFSTGFTMAGSYNYSGHYSESTIGSNWRNTSNDVRLYAYANVAYDVAATVKKQATLYSIGLFQNLEAIPNEGKPALEFFKLTALDIATSQEYFYDVDDPSKLEFIFGEVAEDIISGKIYGTFNFSSASDKDFPATYYYDDDYFSNNASEYNPSLSTMSLCFELSAWGSNLDGKTDYKNKARNARDLLSKIGFIDVEINEYFTVKPSEDSMGVIVAHKEIKASNGSTAYTLIALATRGGGYEAEWAGNFTIGASGQHQGFKTASNEAYRYLSNYISNHHNEFQSEVKFWFTGYSRAGATVNLLAARLNDEGQIAGVTVEKEKLFAYCFEPPMGALQSDVTPAANYNNIHNIVNPSDPVTKVAPKEPRYAWGFARYGVDEPVIPTRLTSSNNDNYVKMLTKYEALNTDWTKESVVNDTNDKLMNSDKILLIDTFQAKKIDVGVDLDWDWGHWEMRSDFFGIQYPIYVNESTINPHLISDDGKDMSAFLDGLLLSLAVGLENRTNYTNNLQASVRLATAQFMGGGYESYKWEKSQELFNEKMSSHLPDLAYALVLNGITGVEILVTQYFLDSLSEAGIDIGAYASVPNALATAIKNLVHAVVYSIITSGGNDLITLGFNYNKLFPAHYPELCLAWLQMQDVNYTPEGQKLFVINAYRVVRINCPVDVTIFNSQGSLVAQIINDVPQNVQGSMIVSNFSSDGEKVIYLPADEDYDIKFTATDDGELNYSVSEFSYDTSTYSKIVNYYDVPITKGEVLTGDVNKFLPEETIGTGDGSARLYTLSTSDKNLTPNIELMGEKAQKAIYPISVENNNINGGTVLGGGAYTAGSFAQVAAIAFEKCQFVGWYKGETLISKDLIYRFRVENSTKLIAKFSGERPTPEKGAYSLTIVAGTGGDITDGANGYYSDGAKTTLVATPKPGYKFKNWTSRYKGEFENPNNSTTTFIMSNVATTVTANFETLLPNGKSGLPLWLIIAIISAMLVLSAVVVIIIIVINSKKSKTEDIYEIPVIRSTQDEPDDGNRANLIAGSKMTDIKGISILSGSMKGTIIPIKNGETLNLGKDPKVSHIIFSNDYNKVSRLHCTVTYDLKSNKYFVTDSSSNGTYSSKNIRFEKGKRIPIAPNSIIKLGNDDCSILLI